MSKFIHAFFLLFLCLFCSGLFANHKVDGRVTSAATDYFRSAANGNWNATSTWESSSDNVTWVAANLTPDFNSAGISIRNTVTINSIGISADELSIESGATLINNIPTTGGAFTIINGVGTDFTINNGATYQILSLITFNAHTSFSAGSLALVKAGGRVLIGNGVNTVGTNNHFFATTASVSNVTWETNAIYEWNSPTVMSFSNANFFQSAYLLNTTPTLKISTSQTNLGVSSTFPATINGRLQINAKVKITSTGIKMIRGGIVFNDSLLVSGKIFLEDGQFYHNCVLSGTSVLIMETDSLHIKGYNQFEVNVLSDIKIIGNIKLEERAFIKLNNYTTTIDGRISGGFLDWNYSRFFVRTFGATGKLKLMNIGASPVDYPIGYTYGADEIYCPATITNTGTIDNFAMHVKPDFPVCLTLAQQQNSVEATWDISEDVVGGSNVGLTLVYGVDGLVTANVGPGYSAAAAKIVHCETATSADYASGSVNGTTVTAVGSGFTNFSPFGITSDPGLLQYLPLKNVNFRASIVDVKNVALTWTHQLDNPIAKFEIERSSNGINFSTIINNITGTQTSYLLKDQNPAIGLNYYRLKGVTSEGRVYYSGIRKITTAKGGLEIKNISVPPGAAEVSFTAAYSKMANAKIEVFNLTGNLVQTNSTVLQPTQKRIIYDISKLAAGNYVLKVQCEKEMFSFHFFKN